MTQQGTQHAKKQVATLCILQVATSEPEQCGSPHPLPEVGPHNVQLLTMYGRVYCCHLDAIGQRVQLSRIYK